MNQFQNQVINGAAMGLMIGSTINAAVRIAQTGAVKSALADVTVACASGSFLVMRLTP